ncbi:MAG: DUF2269 family protein [Solirubrobacterales bacterium]
MIVADVQFYDVVVWLHVSAVVVGFGPTFAFGLYLAFIGKNHPRSIPAVFEAQTLVVRTMTTIGALVVFASGIYLAADRWEFSDAFVIVGMVAVVVLLGLAYGFFEPHDRRAKEIAERDIAAAGNAEPQFSDEFWAATKGSRIMGPIAGLIVILAIYFMAAKPFL